MEPKELYELLKAKVAKKEALNANEQEAFDILQKRFETPSIEVPDTAKNAADFVASCQKNNTVDDNRDGVASAMQKMQGSIQAQKAVYQDSQPLSGNAREDYRMLLESKATNYDQKAIQDLNDAAIILKAVIKSDPSKAPILEAVGKSLTSRLQNVGILQKAMYSTSTGHGLEFVSDSWSAQMLDLIEMQKKLPNLIPSVRMTTKTLTIPVGGASVMAYKLAEATADTPWLQASQASAQTLGTGNLTLSAVKMGFNTFLSYEAVEYSIVSIMPYIREQLASSIINAMENALINGDTTATHMDAAAGSLNHTAPSYGTSSSSDTLWKGIRKLSSAGSLTLDMSTFTSDTVLALFAKLGVYFQQGAPVASPSQNVMFRLLKLKDADGRPIVVTQDLAGQYATLFTGQLPQIWGVPLIPSAYVRNDLSSAGVSDGSSTRSCLPVFASKMFVRGIQSDVTIEAERIPVSRQYGMYVTAGGDLKPIVTPSTAATACICACGINIDSDVTA